ncbi:hypothetical protein N0V84_007032 [Fusarium piperis]|uniref:RING-type domain-containing protein n=1 Tax=Fusarium piperis TaxID=1435070 RepID=A0A9W9BM62_9HYPO|nr:hypothetical protein N0V84_007032 [Fusarium piperis]
MSDVTACLQYPLEIRTEMYDVPCPECTQDNPGVLSARPIHTYRNQSPNMTSEILASIANAYASEIINLTTSFFRIQIHGENLEEPAWNVYQRGLYCTLEEQHIMRDRPQYVEGPDAAQVRIRDANRWFYYSFNDPGPSQWANDHFAKMPNQLWLNMHEASSEKYKHLQSQIRRAAAQLDQLGPSIQVGGNIRTRRSHVGFFRSIVNLGQFTATKLIAFPSIDPGITADFLDLLMRNHFLTALCPYLDTTHAQVDTLECRQPATQDMERLLAFSCLAFRDEEKRSETTFAVGRHDRLVDALERNRAISHRNGLVKKRTAEGFALCCLVDSSYAAGKTQTCIICADDFDDVNDESDIPRHLRAMETRCCHQFMHTRCFKGSALQREKCPLCNRNLEELGLSTEIFVPEQRIEEEIRRGDLPEGMIDGPTSAERNLVEYNYDLLGHEI